MVISCTKLKSNLITTVYTLCVFSTTYANAADRLNRDYIPSERTVVRDWDLRKSKHDDIKMRSESIRLIKNHKAQMLIEPLTCFTFTRDSLPDNYLFVPYGHKCLLPPPVVGQWALEAKR